MDTLKKVRSKDRTNLLSVMGCPQILGVSEPRCLGASVSLRHGTDTSAVVEIAESRSDRLSIGVGERLLERGLASLECA